MNPSPDLTSHSAEEMSVEEIKYGERQIAEGKLITFPNPRIGRRYEIHITLPEFTCDPLETHIKGDFAPRGNVHTVVEVHHQKSL